MAMHLDGIRRERGCERCRLGRTGDGLSVGRIYLPCTLARPNNRPPSSGAEALLVESQPGPLSQKYGTGRLDSPPPLLSVEEPTPGPGLPQIMEFLRVRSAGPQESLDQRVTIHRSMSGFPRVIWGEDLRLRCKDAGHAVRDIVTIAKRFGDELTELDGALRGGLMLLSKTRIARNRTVIRLGQNYAGKPIRGSFLLLTFNEEEQIVRVVTYREPCPTPPPDFEMRNSVAQACELALTCARAHLPEGRESEVTSTSLLWLTNNCPGEESLKAGMLVELTLAPSSIAGWVVVDLTALQCVDFVPAEKSLSPSPVELSTAVRAVEWGNKDPHWSIEYQVPPCGNAVISADCADETNTMVDPFSRRNCFRPCSNSEECGEGWFCGKILPPPAAGQPPGVPGSTGLYGLCYSPGGLVAPKFVTVFDNGWTSQEHAYAPHVRNFVSTLKKLSVFYLHVLNRDSWDNAGGPFKVMLYATVKECEDMCVKQGEGAWAFASAPVGDHVNFFDWAGAGSDSLKSSRSRAFILAHEFAHKMMESVDLEISCWDPVSAQAKTYNVGLSACMGETLGNVFGGLFAAWMYGGSDLNIFAGGDCWPTLWKECDPYMWNYNVCGLNKPYTSPNYLPYVARSAIDAPICGVDQGYTSEPFEEFSSAYVEYCCHFEQFQGVNHCLGYKSDPKKPCPSSTAYMGPGTIFCGVPYDWGIHQRTWQRFARVLSEGSSCFDKDSMNEEVADQFASFVGIGIESTAAVVYEAAIQTCWKSSSLDFVQLILASGVAQGKPDPVSKALGIAGYLAGSEVVAEGPAQGRAAASWFEHVYSTPNKTVYAWRSPVSKEIILRWHSDNGPVDFSVPTSGNGPPSTKVHANRLYVAWVTGDSQLALGWLEPDMTFAGPYETGHVPELEPRERVELASFNGSLLLLFANGPQGELAVLSCKETGGECNLSSVADPQIWNDFGGSPIWTVPGESGFIPGISATAAAGVFGIPEPDEFLYVFGACEMTDIPPLEPFRLKVVRLNALLNVVDTAYVPAYFASYSTAEPLGIIPRRSAYAGQIALDEPAMGNIYLHLAWTSKQQQKLMWTGGGFLPACLSASEVWPQGYYVFHSVMWKWDHPKCSSFKKGEYWPGAFFTAARNTDLRASTGVAFEKDLPVGADILRYVWTDDSHRVMTTPLYGRY